MLWLAFDGWQVDVLYTVFSILPASDSWAWINCQENVYSTQHSTQRFMTVCIFHTKCQSVGCGSNVGSRLFRPANG